VPAGNRRDCGIRPSAWGAPPRPQAFEYFDRRRRPRANYRLWPREASAIEPRPDIERPGVRYAKLHVARTGGGAARDGWTRERRLFAGHDSLRTAHRPPAVPQRKRRRNATAGAARAADPASAARFQTATRLGNDLSQVSGKGASS